MPCGVVEESAVKIDPEPALGVRAVTPHRALAHGGSMPSSGAARRHDVAIVRPQAKAALIGLGWKSPSHTRRSPRRLPHRTRRRSTLHRR